MKKLPSLHAMTEYSLLESSIRINDLISFAISRGLSSLVISDHNNMFGVAEFINKCKKNKIKPIIGLDLDVENYRLLLIALNYDGFIELVRLSSKKNFSNQINKNDIIGQNLIIIEHPNPQFRSKDATSEFEIFPNFYTTSNSTNHNYIDLAYTRFLLPEDAETIKIIDTLKNGKLNESAFKDNYKLIGESCSTYNRIKKIVDSCNIDFPQNDNPIPRFDPKLDSKTYFRDLINKNARLYLRNKVNKKLYADRLREEVKIIEKLNFQDYFLLIYDLVRWSKEQKILIGPGRGSAAGSLVSYVLNITEVDPLEHGLLFERFLNPERITMPDIDIDIQDNKRELVIKYLINKYGSNRVGLISTFQRLAARASLREVGRIMNISLGDVLEITKLIPIVPINITLEKAYTTSSRFRAKINSNETYLKLFQQSKKIEGLPKNLGTHAAGVVIADRSLESFVPVIKSSESYTQVQYAMDYLEENGLLKIDLLGLRNLTILQDIKQEIFKNHNRNVDFLQIPHSDPKTNQILSNGNTNGIFQLESYGMKKTLVDVQIGSVSDLADVISLFRPGPMEFIKAYASVKNGKNQQRKVDQQYDAIVNPTHGIIVYQEQIMEIAQKYASMTFGRADILRRAIGKKNRTLIESIKAEFISGSLQNGHKKEEVENVFELIKRFADYGFNKSHAIAYALLGYRMAYLKAWFPFEFYTALIKSSIASPTTLKSYIHEAKLTNIKISHPQINISQEQVFNRKPFIYLPLVIIKGLGSVANAKIVSEQKHNGAYQDFFDFVARCKLNSISDQVLLSIIKANALSKWGNMTTFINALPHASRYASMITKTINGKKTIDFTMLQKPKLVILKSDINSEIKNEKEAIGFNISIFKTLPYEQETKIASLSEKQTASVIAQLLKSKTINDKNGNPMGIFTLQDSSNEIEAFAFKNVYQEIIKTKRGQIVKCEITLRNKKYIINKKWEIIYE